jgi:hypothetical protein
VFDCLIDFYERVATMPVVFQSVVPFDAGLLPTIDQEQVCLEIIFLFLTHHHRPAQEISNSDKTGRRV